MRASFPLRAWKADTTHSLNLLAGSNAIPGTHLKALPWHKQAALVFRTGGTRSTRPNALLAPLRAIAADAYSELNTALAQCVFPPSHSPQSHLTPKNRRNTKDLARLTTSSYRTHTLALVKTAKARNPQAVHMRWTLHRHVSPVQIVSLRATQGYMAPQEPRGGHRLLVHALVKFDTEQVGCFSFSYPFCASNLARADRSSSTESRDVQRARRPSAHTRDAFARRRAFSSLLPCLLTRLFFSHLRRPALYRAQHPWRGGETAGARAVARPCRKAARDGVPRAREEGLVGDDAVAVPRADVVEGSGWRRREWGV